jgi:hypothetical protein
MTIHTQTGDPPVQQTQEAKPAPGTTDRAVAKPSIWRRFWGATKASRQEAASSGNSTDGYDEIKSKPEKWSLGVLNDRETDEVPGM